MRITSSLLAMFALFLCFSAFAGTNTIAVSWDASPDATVTNYCLYVSTNSGAFTNDVDGVIKTNLEPFVLTVNTGTNTTATLKMPTSVKWYFVVTAQAWAGDVDPPRGYESDASNEVAYSSLPPPPMKLRIQLLR